MLIGFCFSWGLDPWLLNIIFPWLL